ncbi:hypothetical protein G9C85_04970 [Halorubellus sp. JP-L1]|uniref:hypothetical protein n=1 Tax=Halorubellus sp. JP-L1 TaxID=2715753 RepID=UPI001409951A|nr:hypothetical protein [Halorubellus sp. JP-L1]NHN40989.1 hypothetical protein [Halorubellus sp. JP-L1]
MKDTQLNALAHERRRQVLLALHETDGAIALDPTATDDELGIEMYHRHLPKLQSSELVSWNADSGEVRQGTRFDELQSVLDALAARTTS